VTSHTTTSPSTQLQPWQVTRVNSCARCQLEPLRSRSTVRRKGDHLTHTDQTAAASAVQANRTTEIASTREPVPRSNSRAELPSCSHEQPAMVWLRYNTKEMQHTVWLCLRADTQSVCHDSATLADSKYSQLRD
jgi:hypothetical protein